MIVVKNCKCPFRLFQKKIGLEVVFDNYLVRKQVVLDYKNIDFKQWPYCFFSKGTTHDFGRKMEISSLYVFGQMDLEILFDDHTPSQTIKCWILQSCHAEIFTQGLTQDFGQISSLFVCFFGKISLEIMSDDHLVTNQALTQSKVLANLTINKLFFSSNK